jgi:outer membrane receptor for ferrienterochelin and colicins
MNKNKIALLYFILFSSLFFSQEIKKDTLKTNKLEEVIITGQLSPQSVKKSVFEVKVISQKDIEKQAGSNMADLLTNELNLTVTPNTGSGRSTVSLFGLDGQYFKILIDGTPMVSDTGLGNDIDLTQISLENVKQVEIVEGSMAVTFGENAVTGIINIITKKSSNHQAEIVVSLQEETIGDEFEFFNQGRHIQTIKLANNITDKFYVSVNIDRNDFTGFLDDRKGQYYNETVDLNELNTIGRGYRWLPKEQLNIKTLLSYKNNNFNIFYKLDYFNENLDLFNPVVDQNVHAPTQIANPFAFDSEFDTNRLTHLLNANGKFNNGISYNTSVSYQEQIKDVDQYQYFINLQSEVNNEKTEYLSLKAVHSKGTFSNFFIDKKYDFQVGYELSNQEGFGSSVTGLFSGSDIKNQLTNYDFFAEAEYHVNDQLSFRPGVRYSFQSDFEDQFAGSLSTKYGFNKGLTLRNIIGTSYRTPNFEELFTFFVDSAHDVQGNENLTPEKSYSLFTHLNKETWFNDDTKLINKLKFTYLDVSDKIILALVDATSSPNKFQFINIDTYQFIGVSVDNSLSYNNFKGKLGISVSGISQVLDSEVDANDDFLFAFEANSTLSYHIPKWKANFNLSYKFTGEISEFIQKRDQNGDFVFEKGTRESYSWMNASIQKKFYSNKLTATVGARNIFNIKEIETTAVNGGLIGDIRDITFGYGTSYFIKLKYNLNI